MTCHISRLFIRVVGIFRSEKNATPWSKERLKELLVGQTCEKGPIIVSLDEFRKLEGEATANNRKAKLIFLYEWIIELPFVGKYCFYVPCLCAHREFLFCCVLLHHLTQLFSTAWFCPGKIFPEFLLQHLFGIKKTRCMLSSVWGNFWWRGTQLG